MSLKNPELEKIRQEGIKVSKAVIDNSSDKQLSILRNDLINAITLPEHDKAKVIEALMPIMNIASVEIEFIYYLADHDDWFEGAVVFANALAEK